MFQYDAFGKIKEVYMVDYQIPKYGTVAQDLLYFLLSSTKLEDKLTKFDYYIKVYHEYLVAITDTRYLLFYNTYTPSCDGISGLRPVREDQ